MGGSNNQVDTTMRRQLALEGWSNGQEITGRQFG